MLPRSVSISRSEVSFREEIVGQQSPAFVIFPSSADAQVAFGEALGLKSDCLDQIDGMDVLGLNIGFQAMEGERPKGFADDQLQAFTHQALPGKRVEGVEAEEGILEVAADDIVEIDESHQVSGSRRADESALVLSPFEALQVEVEITGIERGVNPGLVEIPAAAGGFEKGGAVALSGRPNGDSGLTHERLRAV